MSQLSAHRSTHGARSLQSLWIAISGKRRGYFLEFGATMPEEDERDSPHDYCDLPLLSGKKETIKGKA
jgi:hypothetical protein